MDFSTINHKLLMGYQGWFSCPGDGGSFQPWFHWFRNQKPDAANMSFEIWPDLREFAKEELFDTHLKMADGSTARLYSACVAASVARHFKWMADYGLDGVLVQRFSNAFPTRAGFLDATNLVLENVAKGAAAHGRAFGVMYDVSGKNPAWNEVVKSDWKDLVDNKKITTRPGYLHHQGLPFVTVWGLGFTDRPAQADQALDLIGFFRNNPEPRYRAFMMGGVPAYWRTRGIDSLQDPLWDKAYRALDIVSPWTVGRFNTLASADEYCNEVLKGDVEETRKLGREYMPVIFPGFSWHNLWAGSHPPNEIPRLGGNFYWKQFHNAVSSGCEMIYNAMFDEMDEGTSMFKMAATKAEAPVDCKTLTMDADGYKLPSDWYLRLAGTATKVLRGELPVTDKMPLDPLNPD